MEKRKFFSWSSSYVSLEDTDIVIFGVPLGRDSARMADFLRDTSWFIESFDPNTGRDLLDKIKIFDAGNIALTKLEDISEQTKKIVELNKIPLIFGKSHLLTLYALKAFDDVKLVSFDAHADIKEYYMDERIALSTEPLKVHDPRRLNCATWLRRFCELGNDKNVCLLGTRSCDDDDYNYIRDNRILHFTPLDIRKNISKVKKTLAGFCRNSKVYVTLDMDFFDPSIAPSVEHPEHDGLIFQDFQALVNEICKGRIVGLDLTEIQYLREKACEVTATLAARAILEILSKIK
ncbi:arginase family protein [Candidatus Bathyarchaeota archaeon]|nr:arginase family protein [Candidatus Bathyarchaeota archaeon]